MSHIPFHRWGPKNNDQTQNIINGQTYGSGIVSDGHIQSGELLFYTYQPANYSFKKNPNFASGRWGCFSDETAFVVTPDDNGSGTIFPRYWMTGNGASSGGVKDGTSTNELYAVGVSVNTTDNTDDLLAVQSSGVCQIAWYDGSSDIDLGYQVDSSSQAGKIKNLSSSGGQGSFGVIANRGSAGSFTGYIWVKLNLVELYSDIRLKENIRLVGKSPSGINIYEFEYKNKLINKGVYRGVIAQELDKKILKIENGYYKVDYTKIDVDPEILTKQLKI